MHSNESTKSQSVKISKVLENYCQIKIRLHSKTRMKSTKKVMLKVYSNNKHLIFIGPFPSNKKKTKNKTKQNK